MLLDSDDIRLKHMIQSGREAVGYVQTSLRADLETNRQLLHSILRCLEIMGEAASRVSLDYRDKHPEVPWRKIISMRNRITHTYFDINHDIIWRTATVELSKLLPVLEVLLDAYDQD